MSTLKGSKKSTKQKSLSLTRLGRNSKSKVKQYIATTERRIKEKLKKQRLGDEYEDISALNSYKPFSTAKFGQSSERNIMRNDF